MTADANGLLKSVIKYSAFGEIRSANGVATTDYLYTGQRNESEIGLDWYTSRFYDPALGRFIQPDSLIPDPGSSKGYDRYAYVNNNPINFNDPSGHRLTEDDKGGGFCCKDPKLCNGTYSIAFQIFPVANLNNLGRNAEEGYSNFSSSGDSATYVNALGAQSPELNNPEISGLAALGIINDGLQVGNVYYQKATTPYDQVVSIDMQTTYEGTPYTDARRVVSVASISITNNSKIQQVMNYSLNINGSGTRINETGSASPGETITFDFTPISLYYEGIDIEVYALSGCIGPCIQSINPLTSRGYVGFNVSPY